MCVKFPLKDLNSGPYPPHSISTYTCGVTIVPRVCGNRHGDDYKLYTSVRFLWTFAWVVNAHKYKLLKYQDEQ